jgi:hypothetical protein
MSGSEQSVVEMHESRTTMGEPVSSGLKVMFFLYRDISGPFYIACEVAKWM